MTKLFAYLAVSLVPALVSIGLVMAGTVTEYVATTNLVMMFFLFCIFVCSIFFIYRGRTATGFCCLSAAFLIALVFYEERQVRFYFYEAQIFFGGKAFVESCVPKDGVRIRQSNVRICKEYGIGRDVDIIVLIQGETSPTTIIADVANADSPAMWDNIRALGYGWGNGARFSAHKLMSDYYLIHDHP